MMGCGESNHNVHDVHGGYEEEMAPSSDVNDTDEEESNNSVVHKPLEGSGKGLVTALALKTKARSKKYKKARYAVGNVSMKDLSNKIKEFEKLSRYLM